MNWTQVISIIVGSSVLSTLLNIFYSSYRENQEKRKLYGPVRFYLMLMKNNSEIRETLLKSRQSLDKKLGFRDRDNERMRLFAENNKELTDEWWIYTKKVLEQFEQNPQYIKDKHWPMIAKLFRSHILRKTVSGEAQPKDHILAYDDDVFTEDNENTFVKTLEELRENL